MYENEKDRILVIEDDASVAKGLVYGLEEEGYQVAWADNGPEGLEQCRSFGPQLIVLDVRLPGMNGLDICRKLREKKQTMPIVMLTARDEEADRIAGLEMGADDYMIKPFSLRELISRIRAQLRRAYGDYSTKSAGAEVRFGEISVDLQKLRVFRSGSEIFLTPIEFKLLTYLLENRDIPLSRDRLIEQVWGDSINLEDPRTVDVHIRHLREKLEDDPSSPAHIKTVRGFGYKFDAFVKKP